MHRARKLNIRIILYINKEKIDKYDQIFPDLEFRSFFQKHEGIYALSSEEREKLAKMFETIMYELNGGQSWSRALVDLTIVEFFINLWRKNRPEVFFQEKAERRKRGKVPLIHEVSEYISEHFCEHIPLEIFSEKFGVSESYLSRSFKDVMGITGIHKCPSNSQGARNDGGLRILHLRDCRSCGL